MASLSGRTMIYRGLGSGILRATRENVKVEFVNNKSTNEFKTIVWRTDSDNTVPSYGSEAKSSEKATKSSETSSEKAATSSEIGSEKATKSSEKILKIIKGNSSVTIAELAKTIGISSRAVEKQIRTLRESGKLSRVGGDFGGHWEIHDS